MGVYGYDSNAYYNYLCKNECLLNEIISCSVLCQYDQTALKDNLQLQHLVF